MAEENWTSEVDSKYRLVLLAARRSKQLQKGAHPRVRSNAKKFTRIALEEAQQGELHYMPLAKELEVAE
ncbi:MAG: DNA-directed RNA polymerase subunit omega [Acidobacteria bacterium]|nr:DNA-directed RNA polymerase subunit omega [Acidobacteriota bacterium]